MALRLIEAPAEGLDLVREYAPGLLAAHEDGKGLSDGVEIAPPFPLFTATAGDVMEAQLLSAARQTAWLYPLIDSNERAVGLAEVATQGAEGEEHLDFAALHGPDQAAELLRAVASAEQLLPAAPHDHDLRILRASGVSLLAVWLHLPEEDRLLPIEKEGSESGWGEGLWGEVDLTEGLRPLAELRRRGI